MTEHQHFKQRAAELLLWYHLQGVKTAHVSCAQFGTSAAHGALGIVNNGVVMGNRLSPENMEARLAHLHQRIKQFTKCALSASCLNTVFSDGNPSSAIMVVGEAPGAEEDRLGKPFVGPSGQLLDAILHIFGWDRTSCYITNIVPWRPPFNRQPSNEEIELCLPFVDEHIQIVAPKIVVCVGAVACKSLLRTTQSISALQQTNLMYHNPLGGKPIPTFAFYHPAYLLRSPGQKRVVWRNMLRMKTFLMADPRYADLFQNAI